MSGGTAAGAIPAADAIVPSGAEAPLSTIPDDGESGMLIFFVSNKDDIGEIDDNSGVEEEVGICVLEVGSLADGSIAGETVVFLVFIPILYSIQNLEPCV
mmetsp:Transcript_6171/g.7026  ORF Transcript_6171/g.7026 Transcript_6171/m.7026 type:complete len:100 (+) Transcript_6171:1826-2125(+)